MQFKDGIASEIFIWVELEDVPDDSEGIYPGTGATVHLGAATRSCNPHYSTFVKANNGGRRWRVVRMDSCVLPEERAKALAISSGCLARIGGCKTPEEILPRVSENPLAY